MGLRLLAVIAGVTLSTFASAGWLAAIQDDIFSGGKKAMLAGEVDNFHALIFDCTADSLALSIIEKSKWQDGMERITYRLLVKVDQGEVHDFAGVSSQRNDEYIQIATQDRDGILKLLGQVRDAQSQIQIGLKANEIDSKWSGIASVVGSTLQAERFMQACNLNQG